MPLRWWEFTADMPRVMIVEDEVLIGLVLEDILEMIGCAVVGNAGTLETAGTAIDELGDAFDVAILDVHLEGDSVYPLADRITEMGKRIVFATGSHRDSLPPRFAGCAVLEKPYALAAVEAVMKDVSAAAG